MGPRAVAASVIGICATSRSSTRHRDRHAEKPGDQTQPGCSSSKRTKTDRCRPDCHRLIPNEASAEAQCHLQVVSPRISRIQPQASMVLGIIRLRRGSRGAPRTALQQPANAQVEPGNSSLLTTPPAARCARTTSTIDPRPGQCQAVQLVAIANCSSESNWRLCRSFHPVITLALPRRGHPAAPRSPPRTAIQVSLHGSDSLLPSGDGSGLPATNSDCPASASGPGTTQCGDHLSNPGTQLLDIPPFN